jgi:hypothetical protein
MASRPAVRGCYGRNPKTGKKVGERHRWPNGWGKGRCEFCGKFLEDVLEKPAKPDPATLPLDVILERAKRPEKPAHCVYPHCKCKEPRWCYDKAPAGVLVPAEGQQQ